MTHKAPTSGADLQASEIYYVPTTTGDWAGMGGAPSFADDALDKLAAKAAASKGDTGAAGATGATGPAGARGLQGDPGASGSATAYTPADASKWATSAPTTIASALDRIAAALGATTPIP